MHTNNHGFVAAHLYRKKRSRRRSRRSHQPSTKASQVLWPWSAKASL